MRMGYGSPLFRASDSSFCMRYTARSNGSGGDTFRELEAFVVLQVRNSLLVGAVEGCKSPFPSAASLLLPRFGRNTMRDFFAVSRQIRGADCAILSIGEGSQGVEEEKERTHWRGRCSPAADPLARPAPLRDAPSRTTCTERKSPSRPDASRGSTQNLPSG